MSIAEFLNIYGIKETTVKKRINDIPGLEYCNGEYRIIEGTRYPYNIGRSKLKDQEDKIYILLKATSENKYIDHNKLKLQKRQFTRLLTELEHKNLIEKNGINNPYGANAYDITYEGTNVLRLSKNVALKLLSELAGRFVGGFATTTV